MKKKMLPNIPYIQVLRGKKNQNCGGVVVTLFDNSVVVNKILVRVF
jgi:hypothetical protein